MGGWGGRGGGAPSIPPLTHTHTNTYTDATKLKDIKLTTYCTVQNTEYRIKKLVHIKLTMYLFFYIAL
jgi:hypothetical protein